MIAWLSGMAGKLVLFVGEVLIIVAFGLILLAIWHFARVAYFKADSIRIDWIRKMVQGAVADGSAALHRIVKDLQNEFVDEWKRAAADGKLTDAEKARLKELVRERFEKTVPASIVEILKNNLPDFDAWVDSQVNAYVWDLKAKADGARAISFPLAAEPSGSAS